MVHHGFVLHFEFFNVPGNRPLVSEGDIRKLGIVQQALKLLRANRCGSKNAHSYNHLKKRLCTLLAGALFCRRKEERVDVATRSNFLYKLAFFLHIWYNYFVEKRNPTSVEAEPNASAK